MYRKVITSVLNLDRWSNVSESRITVISVSFQVPSNPNTLLDFHVLVHWFHPSRPKLPFLPENRPSIEKTYFRPCYLIETKLVETLGKHPSQSCLNELFTFYIDGQKILSGTSTFWFLLDNLDKVHFRHKFFFMYRETFNSSFTERSTLCRTQTPIVFVKQLCVTNNTTSVWVSRRRIRTHGRWM